jgi:hypothetical protein
LVRLRSQSSLASPPDRRPCRIPNAVCSDRFSAQDDTVAGEPIDRDTLKWIVDAADWASQRQRFDALAGTWQMLLK